MELAIIVTKNGGGPRRIEKSKFDREHVLQKYLSENPTAIPIRDISGHHPFMLGREYPVSAGFIDILCADADGGLYVVETKLSKNSDKRSVLAQVLDYGASLYSSGPNDFIAELETGFLKQYGMDLSRALMDESMDAERVKAGLRSAIRDATIRFVILMDEVSDDLKDLVSFMNENSKFDIYLVELELYKDGDVEIAVPRVFGEEATKRLDPPEVIWDEPSFMNDVRASNDASVAGAAKEIIDWFGPRVSRVDWRHGKMSSSYAPALVRNNMEYHPFKMTSTGKIVIYFQHYLNKPPLDSLEIRRELMRRLNQIQGVSIEELSLDRKPSISLQDLTAHEAMDTFLGAFEWLISMLDRHASGPSGSS